MDVLDIDTLVLAHGSHNSRDEAVCVMEAVAWFANEPHSDHPQCASKVLTAFLMSLNDAWDDEHRQTLKQYIPRVVGTNTGAADDARRAWMCTDWLVRTYTPAWLRLAGLNAQAELLTSLPELVGADECTAIKPTLIAVRDDASAAWSAAWSAAESAAWSAAESAAWSAAESAAESAAWSAAESAARSAARSAAESALSPVVDELQPTIHDLIERMLAVGKAE